jgi:hypothetical protein
MNRNRTLPFVLDEIDDEPGAGTSVVEVLPTTKRTKRRSSYTIYDPALAENLIGAKPSQEEYAARKNERREQAKGFAIGSLAGTALAALFSRGTGTQGTFANLTPGLRSLLNYAGYQKQESEDRAEYNKALADYYKLALSAGRKSVVEEYDDKSALEKEIDAYVGKDGKRHIILQNPQTGALREHVAGEVRDNDGMTAYQQYAAVRDSKKEQRQALLDMEGLKRKSEKTRHLLAQIDALDKSKLEEIAAQPEYADILSPAHIALLQAKNKEGLRKSLKYQQQEIGKGMRQLQKLHGWKVTFDEYGNPTTDAGGNPKGIPLPKKKKIVVR